MAALLFIKECLVLLQNENLQKKAKFEMILSCDVKLAI